MNHSQSHHYLSSKKIPETGMEMCGSVEERETSICLGLQVH
jgi:hypothetical protein